MCCLGAIPGLPKVHLHNPVLAYENGDDFHEVLSTRLKKGELDPFVLVVEGSIPNEKIKSGRLLGGAWEPTPKPASRSRRANGSTVSRRRRWPSSPPEPAQPTAAFTPWRAIPPEHGAGRLSRLELALESRTAHRQCSRLPGAAGQLHGDGAVSALPGRREWRPMIPLDEQLRPTWLFGKTVHEGCDRAGYYEQGDFALEYGSPKCLVKLGCWGPVVNCNVTKRGWMRGIGGCPNVGGICIGCTMPGFPDKFMPFMDEPPGARAFDAGHRHLRQA